MTPTPTPEPDPAPVDPPTALRVVVPALLLTVVVFGLDLLTPLGVSMWMPYLLVVLLALIAPGRWPTLCAVGVCTALTVLGLVWDLRESVPPDVVSKSVTNRTLGIVIFWLTAVGGLAARRTDELERVNRQLRREMDERRRLEAQLLRTQRLESVGVLAGGIAHDFNNLLTPLLMSVKMLREDRPPDERAGLLETLRVSAERGAELVRHILSFAGGSEGERRPVAFAPVVREVLGIVAHTFPKGIRLDVRIGDPLPLVTADPTQITQVLMNLCVNARDAMADGGVLAVELEPADVSPEAAGPAAATPGPAVRLTVADTGCGIPPDVLDRIFDPFFTTKGPGQGTGLGLSTVIGIVRGHGGYVTVDSRPGGGARFDTYWPVSGGIPPAAHPRPRDGAAAAPHGLVLVADDEESICRTARLALEEEGYRVVTAPDGAAAVDLFRRHPGQVRAVVLDVMMPGQDGADTFAELCRLDPAARVVVTSGRRPTGVLAEAIAAGRVGFLPKPYSADRLAAAVAGAPAGPRPDGD